VLPVFGLVTQASSLALNQFVYAFALPAMLFIAVYRGSLEEILSGSFLLAVIVATLATAIAGFALSHYSGSGPAESTMRATNIVSFALAIACLELFVNPRSSSGGLLCNAPCSSWCCIRS
jgi:predicted permease